MNKKEILKQGDLLLKERKRFDKDSENFKKRYPQSYTHGNFIKKINGNVFVKKFADKLGFYRPNLIRIEKKMLLIECESWSRTGWSCGELNKMTAGEFEKLVEVDNNYVIEECKRNKETYLNDIKKLEENTIKKINDALEVQDEEI